jgi:putative cell wall-binding protein
MRGLGRAVIATTLAGALLAGLGAEPAFAVETTESSDPEGVPTAGNPVIVTVRAPEGGDISFENEGASELDDAFIPLGDAYDIDADDHPTASPLVLTFDVHTSAIPSGAFDRSIVVFRDDDLVRPCDGDEGEADPDPCVASHSRVGSSVAITVFSSEASIWKVGVPVVDRVAGSDRIDTAVEVSNAQYPSGGLGHVVLVNGDRFPDAVAAGPYAASLGAPILLTRQATLPPRTRTEIGRVLSPGAIVDIVGGPAAVGETIADELRDLGYDVVRTAGADRYETAVRVAAKIPNPKTIVLATGQDFPDALAAGPAASVSEGVVLLTAGSRMPPVATGFIQANGGATRYAVGGPAAAADPQATPVVGADRYATAVAVANEFFPEPTVVGIVNGTAFPDALAAGAILGVQNGPLLLATQDDLPDPTSTYLADHETILLAHLVGGPVVLAPDVREAVEDQLT